MSTHHYNIKDKIVLITGANSGIGKETAIGLAKLGATVVMLCRNEEKGKEVLKEIIHITGNPKIDLFIADLGDPESIYNVVAKIKEKYSQIDILINNAGVILYEREVNRSGFEKTFAINYLGPFLLTGLLLELLKKSESARIINVSSRAHTRGKLNFDDLMLEKNYSAWKAYSNSKLALVLFTYELAHKLKNTHITVNVLHPGFVHSNFGNDSRHSMLYRMFKIISRLGISPQKGALTSIYLASSPEVENVTGKYFYKSKHIKSSKISNNIEIRQKLMEISEKLMQIKY